MVERLLLHRVDAEPGGTAVASPARSGRRSGPRTKHRPRWPSRSLQARGHTSHWIRPSGSACQYRVGTVYGSSQACSAPLPARSALNRMTAHRARPPNVDARAAHPHDHPPARDRPRLPAGQAPRPGARVRRAAPGRRTCAIRRRPRSAAPRRCCSTIDPLALRSRGAAKHGGGQPDDFTLGRFVNDRPYAASSLLAAAIDAGVPQRDARRVAGPAGARRHADPAGDPHPGAALPGRRRAGRARSSPRSAGPSRPSPSRSTSPTSSGAPSRYVDLTLVRDAAARRRAQSALRAAARARRRQALLGRPGRGRQAAARRRGLARRAPRARR